MANPTSTVPFNTNDQNITFLAGSDDPQPVIITMSQINDWYYYTVRLTLTFGVQIGYLLLMILITLIFSKPEKRKTVVFRINIATMGVAFLRILFLALYNDSRGQAFYVYFSFDHSGLTFSNYAVSICSEIFAVILLSLVEASLWLQARTVTLSYERKWVRKLVYALSVFFVVLAVGFRIVFMVENNLGILYRGTYIYFKGNWIQQTSVTLSSVSLIWFCGVFGGKMWLTYRKRKQFNQPQFKPTDYLILGAFCTMIIPTIFAVLQVLDWVDSRTSFPEASSLTLTLTAILLPFSSVFVSMKNDDFNSRQGSLMRSLWDGPDDRYASGGTGKTWNSMSTQEQVPGFELADRNGNKAPTTITTHAEQVHRRDSTEVDLEALGVRVDKSYSVRSGRET